MASLSLIILYTLIPMGLALLGGFVASVYIPKPKLVSTLQHFVSGIVIGAVAVDLIPKILGKSSPWTIGFGFVIGGATMLLLHELAHFLADKEGKSGIPIGLIAGGAIDLLIDGILIGVSFLAGAASGILIAISLSLCAFFLNLTISSTLTKKKVNKGVQTIFVILVALMLPLGAAIGGGVVSQFPPSILFETIAFGVAALLYLGTEELLAEAHEVHDTAWISSAFFIGFLVILLLRA